MLLLLYIIAKVSLRVVFSILAFWCLQTPTKERFSGLKEYVSSHRLPCPADGTNSKAYGGRGDSPDRLARRASPLSKRREPQQQQRDFEQNMQNASRGTPNGGVNTSFNSKNEGGVKVRAKSLVSDAVGIVVMWSKVSVQSGVGKCCLVMVGVIVHSLSQGRSLSISSVHQILVLYSCTLAHFSLLCLPWLVLGASRQVGVTSDHPPHRSLESAAAPWLLGGP